MKARAWLVILCTASFLTTGISAASAHEAGPRTQPRTPQSSQPLPALSDPQFGMDPVMRALLIAMAARILREAAASPDPAAALADALDRSLSAAMASPEALRVLEAVTNQVMKDVPDDLREAMVAFAASLFAQIRRDLVQNRSQSRRSVPVP